MEPEKYTDQKKRITLHRIYFLSAVLAILIAFLTMQALKPFFAPNRVQIDKKTFFKQKIGEFYYNDFDHDGFSEHVIFKTIPEWSEIGVKYYNSKDMLVDQWNFSERWIHKAVFFADFDNDSYDEIYFFTQGNDSIFLYSFDPRFTNQFLIYRQFIVRAPEPNPHPQKAWDVQNVDAVFYDSDHDGYQEMFINIMTGHSLQPRRIFKFDIKRRRIVAKSPLMGAYGGKLRLFDLDGDKTPELFFQASYAPNNYAPQSIPYPDNQSWLMVFNLDLQFAFEPIPFPPAFSVNYYTIFQTNVQTYIAACKTYIGKLDVQPALYLFTPDGQLIRERKLVSENHWTVFGLPFDNPRHLYVCNFNGNLYELDHNLKTVKTIKPPYAIYAIIDQMDYDNDLQDEYLASGASGILMIIEPDFEEITVIPEEINYGYATIYSVCKRGKAETDLIFQTDSLVYAVQYKHNPWYVFRYPIEIGMAFVLFFVITGLLFQAQRFSSSIQMRRQLFHFSPIGFLLLDFKGRLRSVNSKFEQTLKLSAPLSPGVHFSEALQERPQIVSFIQHLIHSQKLKEREFRLFLPDGNTQFLLRGFVHKGLLGTPSGYLIEVVPLNNEQSERKLQLWSKTIQKMAHDIKTPLSTVQLLVQTARIRLSKHPQNQADEIGKDLDTASQQLSRIREMAKQFLRFTNLERPNLQRVSLRSLLEHTLQRFSFYLDEDLHIEWELDEQHDQIFVDPTLIEMVFQIIIENAIDAMNGKGTILITSNLVENIEENFKKYIEIEFIDNGPGMDKDILKHIFDPFFTTKENGTGMGLTLARKIIEDHLGKISVFSESGKSTVIRITIPYREETYGI
ncbi:histidine kinase [Caldithrix abyssi DSM 13497]|uniref:histidine kinase n=1 Tax=Caldithrix abyssi DSM 13497 TaxID=880073 RepID=H1XYH1_CALAY|nr:HAMP domain-containing sensor histidine kinase [Caldithrix abyssi]APF19673.1 His Kinase A (phospho-acceptor) domain-containing protein [Caldithrix abyssi DSM 13497]EHO39789.1 histidine kinase [Caldithrix abyssi DSM 13497]